jgi:hypothetical protein
MVNSKESRTSYGGIYLDHKNQNHYDVVTSVKESGLISFQNFKVQMSDVGAKKKEKKMYKKNKYKTDPEFRGKCITNAKKRYRNDEQYHENLKQISIKRYTKNQTLREAMKEYSKQKYETNMAFKEGVKHRSRQKYETDELHKTHVKQRSRQKYEADESHKADVKRRSRQKYQTDESHKADVKLRSRQKYETDELHKANVKQRSRQKYETDKQHRERVKRASKVKYHSSAETKMQVKESVQKRRRAMHEIFENIDEVVKSFRNSIEDGPEYTCCCCHRLLFESQVQGCTIEMYEKSIKIAHVANLCIDKKYVHNCSSACSKKFPKSRTWICFTCHRKILNGNVPAEATFNKMCLEVIPPELSNLNNLEKHLIFLHIPFMKVMSLPKGGQQNVHGPAVCVHSNIKKTTSLPLNGDENMLLRVKLKRKLSYKGYHEYQFVNPNHIKIALNYLKANNRWYHGIEVNKAWENDLNEDTVSTQTEVLNNEEIL